MTLEIDTLSFDENGLIPAIVQDDIGKALYEGKISLEKIVGGQQG